MGMIWNRGKGKKGQGDGGIGIGDRMNSEDLGF